MTPGPDPTGATDRGDGSLVEVLVGRVGRAHGLSGDVVVEVRTDEPERRFAAGTQFTTPSGRLTVQATHWHGRRLLVRFAEISDRTTAEALRGVELALDVPADERPVDPEEFYDHQLVGLSARTSDGSPVGEVTEVLHLPGQDVLAVRTPGGQTALVPFVRELVPTIELEARHLTVTEKAGLLPAEDSGIPSADGNGTGPRT